MKITVVRGILAALVLVSGSAAAQNATDPRTVPELRQEFDRGTTMGVPEWLLVGEARKGQLMGAPTNRIRDAIHGLTDRHVAARTALKPVVDTFEVIAGANAMRRPGITSGVLQKLRSANKTRSLTTAIGVLDEAVLRGVPVKTAMETVQKMLAHGASNEQIASVGGDLPGMIKDGLAPSVALDVRSRSVLSLPAGSSLGSAAAANKQQPQR
jgi:hypothetical protein